MNEEILENFSLDQIDYYQLDQVNFGAPSKPISSFEEVDKIAGQLPFVVGTPVVAGYAAYRGGKAVTDSIQNAKRVYDAKKNLTPEQKIRFNKHLAAMKNQGKPKVVQQTTTVTKPVTPVSGLQPAVAFSRLEEYYGVSFSQEKKN